MNTSRLIADFLAITGGLIWPALGLLLVFTAAGAVPMALTIAIVHIYPPGHARRQEFVSTTALLMRKSRSSALRWVIGIIPLALWEGSTARIKFSAELRAKYADWISKSFAFELPAKRVAGLTGHIRLSVVEESPLVEFMFGKSRWSRFHTKLITVRADSSVTLLANSRPITIAFRSHDSSNGIYEATVADHVNMTRASFMLAGDSSGRLSVIVEELASITRVPVSVDGVAYDLSATCSSRRCKQCGGQYGLARWAPAEARLVLMVTVLPALGAFALFASALFFA